MTALSLQLDTPELAAHYERASVDRQFRTGKNLIARLGLKPGDRVLDVGAGTGLLAEHVADIVGPRGSVLGVDPLALRIEIAKRKIASHPQLSFEVGDAYQLDRLPAESFDVVYLNAVFHWFPEKLAPLRSFRRLLKRGGKLGISTGSKDHPNRVHDIQRKILAHDPYKAHAKPEQGLPHRVSETELRELLEQTGFEVESLNVEPNTNTHADAEAAILHSQASSFGNLLGHLPETLRAQAQREVVAELDKFRTPEGIQQTSSRLVLVARKPG